MNRKEMVQILKDKNMITKAETFKHTVFDNGKKAFEISYYNKISFSESIRLVSEITDNSFDKNGKYSAARSEFMMRIAVLSHFTDLELMEETESEESINELYDVLFFSPINEFYENVIFRLPQVQDIILAADEAINYRIDSSFHSMEFVKLVEALFTPFENEETKDIVANAIKEAVVEKLDEVRKE